MNFLLFLFLSSTITNTQICKSEEDNTVYRNLYGYKDFNSSYIETLAKFPAGIFKFLKDGYKLSKQEVKDITPKFDEEYDFIVVGAGSAGCAVAARLSEIKNATVLLIEAGRAENLLYDIPSAVHYLQTSSVVNRKYQTEPTDKYCLAEKEHKCNWPRGKVMGGSSVLNYMVATRGHPLDYDGWESMGNSGWSYKEVLKYFMKLEETGVPELKKDKKLHNTEGPLYISHPPYHTPLAEAFVKAGKELGYPTIDYNGEKRIGYSYVQSTIKNGERMSTNRAYLYPNRKRKNLFVSKNSHVNKVLIDPDTKRAYGVKFTKFWRTIRVKARKEIILSAGAIDSPKLLMLSGVGPSDHLKEMKIEVIQDAPVGKNLMDHLSYIGLIFVVDQPVAITTLDLINPFKPYLVDYFTKRYGPYTTAGGIEGIAFINTDKPNDLDAYPNIEFFFVGASIAADPFIHYAYGISSKYWKNTFANISGIFGKYTWSAFPILLHPRSRGEVKLRNKNPKSKPKLIANYFDDPEDIKLMIKGIRAAIEVGKTKAMQRFKSKLVEARIPGCEKFKYDSDDYWECAARAFSTTLYHQCGTCKMAPENDTSGVVNPRLQVKGIKGLRVADASIMPTIITGHPNIPTVMIAEKLADMVKEDWDYLPIKHKKPIFKNKKK